MAALGKSGSAKRRMVIGGRNLDIEQREPARRGGCYEIERRDAQLIEARFAKNERDEQKPSQPKRLDRPDPGCNSRPPDPSPSPQPKQHRYQARRPEENEREKIDRSDRAEKTALEQ